MNISREKSFSALTLGALWFGASVSTAEILTGGMLAPLGWGGGLAVILLGHLIGGLIFFGAGWMSSQTKMNAIGVSQLSFGPAGPKLFGAVNVLQLVGWTAVMVILGSQSLDAIATVLWGFHNPWVWKLVLGALLLIWAASGFEGIRKLNTAAVLLLLALTAVLAWVVFHSAAEPQTAVQPPAALGFSDALELVVVMPLSWLPLVGDYTRRAVSSKKGTLAAALGYVVGSLWMYSIGLSSALTLGTADPSLQMIKAGLGLVGLAIIAISTATSGFLDVVSSGHSFQNILTKANARIAALILGAVGIALALVFPMDQYQNFLLILGAIFAPLYAVLLADFLVLKNRVEKGAVFNLLSFASWAAGVGLYFYFQNLTTVLGATVPTFLLTVILSLASKLIYTKLKNNGETK